MPVALADGAMTVSATINDRPVTMLLDTTSPGTFLIPAAASAFHLRYDHFVKNMVVAQSFSVGGQTKWNQLFHVLDLKPGRTESGAIGPDWLRHFDVEIDLPRQRMALYQEQGCSGYYIPWQKSYKMFSNTTDGPLLVFRVDAHGHSISTQIETDTYQMRVSPIAFGRWKAEDVANSTNNVSRSAYATVGFDLPPLGSQVPGFPAPSNILNPSHKADVFLGTDFLQTHRVWLSYGTGQVFIQQAPAGSMSRGPGNESSPPS